MRRIAAWRIVAGVKDQPLSRVAIIAERPRYAVSVDRGTRRLKAAIPLGRRPSDPRPAIIRPLAVNLAPEGRDPLALVLEEPKDWIVEASGQSEPPS